MRNADGDVLNVQYETLCQLTTRESLSEAREFTEQIWKQISLMSSTTTKYQLQCTVKKMGQYTRPGGGTKASPATNPALTLRIYRCLLIQTCTPWGSWLQTKRPYQTVMPPGEPLGGGGREGDEAVGSCAGTSEILVNNARDPVHYSPSTDCT